MTSWAEQLERGVFDSVTDSIFVASTLGLLIATEPGGCHVNVKNIVINWSVEVDGNCKTK